MLEHLATKSVMPLRVPREGVHSGKPLQEAVPGVMDVPPMSTTAAQIRLQTVPNAKQVSIQVSSAHIIPIKTVPFAKRPIVEQLDVIIVLLNRGRIVMVEKEVPGHVLIIHLLEVLRIATQKLPVNVATVSI